MYSAFYQRSRKRVSDLEKDNQIQGKELQSLKAKAKEAAHSAKERSLTLSRSSEHLIPLAANTPSDKIRSFLSQK